MNNNSYICRWIKSHPDTWREDFEEKKIRVKQDGDLAIFNYLEGVADFSIDIVQEARGIIINLKTLDVVCWPFRKFGNYTAGYSDKIDWSSACVQEKIDGSFIKYFYNDALQKWQWSTMSCIDAKEAKIAGSPKSFEQLIKQADNYQDIINAVNKHSDYDSFTFMFELVSPEMKLVVAYPKTHLYHIGTKSNISGLEYNFDLGVDKPKRYAILSLSDCIDVAARLNTSKECTHEGFVVVDKNWNRIKVKSPEYMVIHWTENNGVLTKSEALRILRENGGQCDQFCAKFKRLATAMRFYSYQYEKLQELADKTATYARGLLEENDGDRKAVVLQIKHLPLCVVGFRALTDPRDGREILNDMKDAPLLKHIPRYVEPSTIF